MKMQPKTRVKTMALKRGLPALSWLLLGLAIVAMLVGLSACAVAPAVPAAKALAPEVTVAQAADLRDQGAFVLDVRTQEEWDAFHIPDSTLIPLDQLPARMAEVPKDADVLVVCRSGNRSAQARDLMLQAGYENVTSLAGGVTEWQAQGLPTVTGP